MTNKEHLNDLHEIKQMMEKSSRFISLSGWSGIAAGICALAGAYFAHFALIENDFTLSSPSYSGNNDVPFAITQLWNERLFYIAAITFISALIFAFLFTYLRSRKNNTPIWSTISRRLIWSVSVPLLAGGIYLLKLVENGTYGLIAPGCLIFYGLALINGSKYTLGEVRYLGYTK
jgi:hypothetical protein